MPAGTWVPGRNRHGERQTTPSESPPPRRARPRGWEPARAQAAHLRTAACAAARRARESPRDARSSALRSPAAPPSRPACPDAARAGSTCRRRRGPARGSRTRSAASRRGRSCPAPPPCRAHRRPGAPRGRPSHTRSTRSSAPRCAHPRRTRAPSRGTNGRRSIRSRPAAACPARVPAPAPRVPRAASRRGSRHAGAGRESSLARARSPLQPAYYAAAPHMTSRSPTAAANAQVRAGAPAAGAGCAAARQERPARARAARARGSR